MPMRASGDRITAGAATGVVTPAMAVGGAGQRQKMKRAMQLF
jgi:hypothetical protein